MTLTQRFSAARCLLLTLAPAVAAVALSVGAAIAQDFRAVERRLGGAIEAGEITIEQANVMMQALRQHARQHPQSRSDQPASPQQQATAELTAELKRAIANEWRSKIGSRITPPLRVDPKLKLDRDRIMFELTLSKIKAAVDRGELSPEEGEQQVIEAKQRRDSSDERKRAARHQLRGRFERRIKAAVERRKLRRSQAQRHLIEQRRKRTSL